MTETAWLVAVDDLASVPSVHGPGGRIVFARQLLGLTQRDFARELVKRGGRCSRETVSHWENLDDRGVPRARATRRNAAVIAALVREGLGKSVSDDMFYDPQETAWDRIARRLEEVLRRQAEISSRLDELDEGMKELLGRIEERPRLTGT